MPTANALTDRPFNMTIACVHDRRQLRLSGPVDLASGANLLDMADVMATFRVTDTEINLSEVSSSTPPACKPSRKPASGSSAPAAQPGRPTTARPSPTCAPRTGRGGTTTISRTVQWSDDRQSI